MKTFKQHIREKVDGVGTTHDGKSVEDGSIGVHNIQWARLRVRLAYSFKGFDSTVSHTEAVLAGQADCHYPAFFENVCDGIDGLLCFG